MGENSILPLLPHLLSVHIMKTKLSRSNRALGREELGPYRGIDVKIKFKALSVIIITFLISFFLILIAENEDEIVSILLVLLRLDDGFDRVGSHVCLLHVQQVSLVLHRCSCFC